MADFSVWTEPTVAGSLRVRHRDPSSGKILTDYVVKKDERMMIDGKMRTAAYIADYYVDLVRQNYRRGSLGIANPIESQEKLVNFVDAFVEEKDGSGLSWKTVIHYEDTFKVLQHYRPLQTLGDFMRFDFKTFANDLKTLPHRVGKAKGYAPHSIRGILVDLNVFCGWLVKNGKIEKSPVPEGILPPQPKARPRFYTDEEFAALEVAMRKISHYGHVGIRLAHDYGLRRIEITGDGRRRKEGVLWEDIIWHGDGKADLDVRSAVTKGGYGERKLRLSEDFLALLGPKQTGPLVPLCYDTFWRYFRMARRDSRINERLTIHGQRHTFAKDILQKAGSMHATQKLMGHNDISTTSKVYAHLEQSYLDETMERLHAARKNDSSGIVSK